MTAPMLKPTADDWRWLAGLLSHQVDSPDHETPRLLRLVNGCHELAENSEKTPATKRKRRSFTIRWLGFGSGTERCDGLTWRLGQGFGEVRRAPNQATSQGLHAIQLALREPNAAVDMTALFSLDAKAPAHAMTEAVRDAKAFLHDLYSDEMEDVLDAIQFSETTGAIRYSPQNRKHLIKFKF